MGDCHSLVAPGSLFAALNAIAEPSDTGFRPLPFEINPLIADIDHLQPAWFAWKRKVQADFVALANLTAPPKAGTGCGVLQGIEVRQPIRKRQSRPDSDVTELIAFGEAGAHGPANFEGFSRLAYRHQFRGVVQQPCFTKIPCQCAAVCEDEACVEIGPFFELDLGVKFSLHARPNGGLLVLRLFMASALAS